MNEQEKLTNLYRDLTLWITRNLSSSFESTTTPTKEFHFWQDFRDGVILCQLIEKCGFPCPHRKPAIAIAIASAADEGKELPPAAAAMHQQQLCQDNLRSFLTSCEHQLKLPGCVLFDPSDLLEGKNDRKVCVCMYHVMKRSRNYGLKVPKLSAHFPPILGLRINTAYASALAASRAAGGGGENASSPPFSNSSSGRSELSTDSIPASGCAHRPSSTRVLYSIEPVPVVVPVEGALVPIKSTEVAVSTNNNNSEGKLCSGTSPGELLTWEYWSTLPPVQATLETIDRLLTFLFTNKIRTVPSKV